MSSSTARPIMQLVDVAVALYRGRMNIAEGMGEGIYNLRERVFALRSLGLQIDLREGRYSLPDTEENADLLFDLLTWADRGA